MSTKQKIRFTILLLVTVAITLLAGGVLYFQSSTFQSDIQDQINRQIPGTINWEKAKLNIAQTGIDFHEFQFLGENGDKILSAKRLSAKLKISGLLRKTLIFSDITILSPEIILSVDRNNTINFIPALVREIEQPSKSDTMSLPLSVIIESLHVGDATLRFDAPQHGLNIFLNKLNFEIRNADILNKSAELDLKFSESKIILSEFEHPIDLFEVNALIENTTITFSNSILNAGDTVIKASGQVNDLTNIPSADLKINSDVSLEHLKHILNLDHSMKGKISSELLIKGTLNDPIVTLNAQSNSLDFKGHQIGQIRLMAELKKDILLIKPSKALTDFGTTRVSGQFNLGKAFPDGLMTINPDLNAISYFFNFGLDQTNLSRVLGKEKQIQGFADTELKINGNGFDPKIMVAKWSSQVAVNQLKMPAIKHPVDLSIFTAGELDHGALLFNHIETDSLNAKLAGKGTLDIFTKIFNLDFTLLSQDINPLAALLNIDAKGSININGNLSGDSNYQDAKLIVTGETLSFNDTRINRVSSSVALVKKGQNYTGSSNIRAFQTEFKNMMLGDILLDARLFGGILNIEKLALEKNESKTEVSGQLYMINSNDGSIIIDPEINLSIKGTPVFLQDFLTDAQGRVGLNGKLTGTISEPKGYAKLWSEKVTLKDTIFENVEARVQLLNKIIQLDQINVDTMFGAHVSGNGIFDLDTQALEILLTSHSFPLSSHPLLKTRGLDSGTLDITLKAEGTILDPVFESRILVKDIIVQQEPLPDIDLKVDLKNRLLTAKGIAGGSIDASYHLDRQWVDIKLKTQNLDLSPYLRMTGQNDFSGRINGNAWARGAINQISSIKVDLDLSALSLLHKQKEIVKADAIKISHEQGHFVLEESLFQIFEKGQASISGTGESFENADILFDAAIPLETFSEYFKATEQLQGMIHLSSRIKGNLKDPDIKGRIGLTNVGLFLPMVEQNLKNINARVELDKEIIRINHLDGYLGEGKFAITGQAGITDFKLQKFDLNLQAQNLPCDIPDVMDLRINSNLMFKGTLEKSSLNGEIVLIEGRYYKDVKLDLATIGQKKRQLQPESDIKENPYLDKIRLGIAVIRQNPFVVDNNLASLNMSPDIQILGTVAHPLLGGRAQIDSGIVRFQKKEFEIKKGVLDFIDPYKIVPLIDIEALAAVRSWNILLAVSGNPENLEFKLTSSPNEEHADILSLLAFGKTTRELRAGQGVSNFTSAQILAGFIAETVQKNLKGATGVDSFDLEVNNNDDGEGVGGTITMGKELSRQLSVKYGVELRAGETVQRVSTDFKLLENILISGYQDSGGDFGGGLKFRLEFR